jgi:TetR/AcrR family transcriptional regulator, transcriptional repressor for nem operon
LTAAWYPVVIMPTGRHMSDKTVISKGMRTRARILREAMELFNIRGYHATSISDIIEASGVQRGNLYFHFKNKEELALALIEEAHREYMSYLNARAKGRTGMAKLDSLLDAIYEYHSGKNFIGGCIFGNIALEMGDQNTEFQKAIRAVFDEWARLITSLLEEALSQGELSTHMEPYPLSRHIVACLEGGIMLSRLTKDKKDILNSLDAIRFLLRPVRNTAGPLHHPGP